MQVCTLGIALGLLASLEQVDHSMLYRVWSYPRAPCGEGRSNLTWPGARSSANADYALGDPQAPWHPEACQAERLGVEYSGSRVAISQNMRVALARGS
jgi:hypothetical protein